MLSININQLIIDDKALDRRIQFDAKPGEFWCIMGMNGSGKSTLLHALAGLTEHQYPIYWEKQAIHNLSFRERAKHFGLLPQDPLSISFATVYDAIKSARYPYQAFWQNRSLSPDCELHIKETLRIMELETHHEKLINQLSGGEQQRLHIAMLLAQNPSVYILDEPTNHLDLQHQIKLLRLLKRLATEEKKLIIAAVHDMNLIYPFADHACFLYPNNRVEAGTITDLFSEKNLSELYQHPIQKRKIQEEIYWLT